jgi:hypothetical protein
MHVGGRARIPTSSLTSAGRIQNLLPARDSNARGSFCFSIILVALTAPLAVGSRKRKRHIMTATQNLPPGPERLDDDRKLHVRDEHRSHTIAQ